MAHQTIHTILGQFREEATSNRDLGDRFERLICAYLQTDPLYVDRFAKVWMWSEWPRRNDVPDVGIDLVAEERATGEFCAIQCKFFLPDHILEKQDIDSFFTASGKKLFTSCLIVSTTDKWSKHAEDALVNQSKPITRLRVQDLDESPVDWSRFDFKRPQDIRLRVRKTPREHQNAAVHDILGGFKKCDRGKLIMACGTGKTFTALVLAKELCPKGNVLFLVPSISLMSQTVREWTAEATWPLHAIAVCSDTQVGKRKGDDDTADILTYDLAFPATTSPKAIVEQYTAGREAAPGGKGKSQMTVVFSTYQSIEAVAAAQKRGLPHFDLVICDEAHRTTGVTLSGEDESHFVKVHDADFVKGKKRLYMTATPRIYADDAKQRAEDSSAVVCSMDDEDTYGPEFHRLGFGESVAKGLLTDYKVLVLAVDEKYVSTAFQRLLADASNELELDDAVKITGCLNGLAKRFDQTSAAMEGIKGDPKPMQRAVAFSRSIKDSKGFVQKLGQILADHFSRHPEDPSMLKCEAEHVDGTFQSLKRSTLLDWLKAPPPADTCRILSNARCLSEGVDVPALDAVLFLNPRKSVIDVVQSVGRVMRRAEGKKYGYIILPIGIPADVPAEEALKDNEKYKVVWQVLQALRAHDDRFNATVNQIELNRKRPEVIQVIGVGGGPGEDGNDGDSKPKTREVQGVFSFPQLDEWKDAIYARIVLKCGDRRYWESWAHDVAQIAERHTTRLRTIIEEGQPKHKKAFASFLEGLQSNINPSITELDAIEMLSQHLITRPVFDALFEGYAFTSKNPVSCSMQSMLETLHDQSLEKETASLEKFYASVRERAKGIDNAEGRQRVVIELYDTFFRTAFPKIADRLGIVYTPVEVVDFIIHSVAEVIHDEFKSSLSDKDVHVIDPFTGTGTFIVRLLQSGRIEAADLLRKYQHELHANEIVLLAYYIAAINIEETFHGIQAAHVNGRKSPKDLAYMPFEGIVLTDTFQLAESRGEMQEQMFPENNRRVRRQKQSPIRIVIGNPPYSVGQGDGNANNQNLKYSMLDERIRSTYAARSQATNKNSNYDSYKRAIRWASDRIQERGVIGFVTNGYFIDGTSEDGIRACLAEEFSSVYVFNLRGNARTSGEQRRMEKGNVFGEGSRTPIAISILVKNPDRKEPCRIRYHDIGDYLTREEKLGIVARFGSVAGITAAQQWETIKPNYSHDWINQRDPAFGRFIAIGDKKDNDAIVVFESYSRGLATARDVWCYHFSSSELAGNMQRLIAFYAKQRTAFAKVAEGKPVDELLRLAGDFADRDSKQIAWTRGLLTDLSRLKKREFQATALRSAMYRPFCKQWVYFDRHLNDMVYRVPQMFPTAEHPNRVICLTSVGNRVDFSTLITDTVPDLHMIDGSGASQCFPLYLYEKEEVNEEQLIPVERDGELIAGYRRQKAITNKSLDTFREAYGKLTKEDVFYYIYGVLHSLEYRNRFRSDLKKMLPRIPLTRETQDFWRFSEAGRALADLHVNYEQAKPWPVKEHRTSLGLNPKADLEVQRMTFGRKDRQVDKTTINYNSGITITGVPLEAYGYVLNGKSAIEWVMDRYQVSVDKDSGIRNDPNAWGRENKQADYVLELLKKVVRVSMDTLKIVSELPPLNERQ